MSFYFFSIQGIVEFFPSWKHFFHIWNEYSFNTYTRSISSFCMQSGCKVYIVEFLFIGGKKMEKCKLYTVFLLIDFKLNKIIENYHDTRIPRSLFKVRFQIFTIKKEFETIPRQFLILDSKWRSKIIVTGSLVATVDAAAATAANKMQIRFNIAQAFTLDENFELFAFKRKEAALRNYVIK